MQKKLTKIIILFGASFFLIKVTNLFLADISFSRGYKANLAGKYEQSVKLIEKAIQLNKYEPTYYRELADSYCMLGQVDNCLENASRALSLNPQNSLTIKALIKTFIRTGLLENAKLLCERLIILAPTDEESRQLLRYVGNMTSNRL